MTQIKFTPTLAGARRRAAVFALSALAGTLLLSACGGGDPVPSAVSAAADTGSRALPMSGKPRVFNGPVVRQGDGANAIAISSGPADGGLSFTLKLPSGADAGSLDVVLNGRSVSSRFSGCGSSGCNATLGTADGVSPVKNVLYATVKVGSGQLASGRLRVAGGSATANGRRSLLAAGREGRAAVSATADTPWLPPTVSFTLTQTTGWQVGSGLPWIVVNGTNYPTAALTGCSGAHYVIISLDRQTLALKDQKCYATGPQASGDLFNRTPQELVIVGNTAGNGLGGDFNASWINGTDFTGASGPSGGWPSGWYPQGYLAVGSGTSDGKGGHNQTPLTAYESWARTGLMAGQAMGGGILQEDANGNYGYRSAEVVQYAMHHADPNNPDPNSGNGLQSVEITVPPTMARVITDRSGLVENRRLFMRNAPPGSQGIWVLVLDRYNLWPVDFEQGSGNFCHDPGVPSNPPNNPQTTNYFIDCGKFYNVGDADATTRDGEWQRLATDLTSASPDQLVFIESIGIVGNLDEQHTVAPYCSNTGAACTGFTAFEKALLGLGGTPRLVYGPTWDGNSMYHFVGYQGAQNALAGGAAEASTAMSGTLPGVMRGTLERNRMGRFQPSQNSTEYEGMFADKGGLLGSGDYLLSVVARQQPVEWPSNSASTLLPGASSIAGQQTAYLFLSHWLLAGYYMKGISGPYQTDIHYFFTGSSNTWLDYHTIDPAALPFPAQGSWDAFGCSRVVSGTCFLDTMGGISFTTQDFQAVQNQLSLEIQYLTNTLQFLVTGSTNMKDIVGAGNANVGLALQAAANTVMGSGMGNLNQQQIGGKSVSFSWQNLLALLGSAASFAANFESFGSAPLVEDLYKDVASQVARDNIKNVTSYANAVGALLGTIGDGASITSTSNNTRTPLPQPFEKLTVTVGELATKNLQSPLLRSFDTMADSLTSDWGRLSQIGPRIVNVNDTTFYAPNQARQQLTVDSLTNASAATFYTSLMPTVYSVHYWMGVDGSSVQDPSAGQWLPSPGSLQDHTYGEECHAFYLTGPNGGNSTQSEKYLNGLSVYTGKAYPRAGGDPTGGFTQDGGSTNFWVIDNSSAVSKPGSTSTHIPTLDGDLAAALFAPDQLNLSLDQFIALNGPMNQPGNQRVIDATTDRGGSGASAGSVCNALSPDYAPNTSSAEPEEVPSGGKDRFGRLYTQTEVTSARASLDDEAAVLTARVLAGAAPVTQGMVYFTVDGKDVGQAAVGADGTAMLKVSGLGTGKYVVRAYYGTSDDTYAPSDSDKSAFGVYANAPDLTISASGKSLTASYDQPSDPLQLTVGSVGGLGGKVSFSCTGLPAGMHCVFDTASAELAADGTLTAKLVIGPSAAQAAQAMAIGLLLLMPLAGVGPRRRELRTGRPMARLLLALAIGTAALTGCGDDSPTRETGTRTILVTATVGEVSRSVAVDVDIR